MSDLSAIFPQLEVLKSCSVQEARDLGIARSKLWESAMECLRLCGRLDDDELCDLVGTAMAQLEFRVGGERAHQSLVQACDYINRIPVEPEPEAMNDGRYA